MIRGFRSKDTQTLFNRVSVARFQGFEESARRKLVILHRAKSLWDLAAVPGNRLEQLKGNRKGQYSIRINDQWRICFSWRDGDAYDVEITDYH